MFYIQMRYSNELETVDEFETYKEARLMLKEYRLGAHNCSYYLSSRACKAWYNKG